MRRDKRHVAVIRDVLGLSVKYVIVLVKGVQAGNGTKEP